MRPKITIDRKSKSEKLVNAAGMILLALGAILFVEDPAIWAIDFALAGTGAVLMLVAYSGTVRWWLRG
jgi:hypothetical protein